MVGHAFAVCSAVVKTVKPATYTSWGTYSAWTYCDYGDVVYAIKIKAQSSQG